MWKTIRLEHSRQDARESNSSKAIDVQKGLSIESPINEALGWFPMPAGPSTAPNMLAEPAIATEE